MFGFEKEPVPPDQVPDVLPPTMLPANCTGVPDGTVWSGPASTNTFLSIVTDAVAVAAVQVPLAAMVLVTV